MPRKIAEEAVEQALDDLERVSEMSQALATAARGRIAELEKARAARRAQLERVVADCEKRAAVTLRAVAEKAKGAAAARADLEERLRRVQMGVS